METSTIGLLRQVPIFASLSEPLLRDLAGHCRRRHYPAQEALFHKDEDGNALYVIISGQIAIRNTLASGAVVTYAQRGPGEHFGELSLIDSKPRMADAFTVVDSELLWMGRQDFVRCLAASPAMALAIMANLADRLREAGHHLERQQELDVLGRLSNVLLNLAETYGKSDPSGEKRIAVKMSQPQLAKQVGATRESVNRALASLQSTNLIRKDGQRWVVLDEQGLRKKCQI